MYIPQTYTAALLMMLVSILCWGSWANTQKIDKAWRFELFYLGWAVTPDVYTPTPMIETALLGLCAVGLMVYAAKAANTLGTWQSRSAASLPTSSSPTVLPRKSTSSKMGFAKWIAEKHPPVNEGLERAVAGSTILGDLFSLMEAEPGTIED
jgi:hypothetical protein